MSFRVIIAVFRIVAFGLCVFASGSAMGEQSYVGNNVCAACHKSESQDWKRSAHGKTMEVLLPGKRSAPKHKVGLNPDKDYSRDEKCLKCHTTGFRKQGGFVNMNTTPGLGGVGCEECHGPGERYRKIHDEKSLDFRSAETRVAGQLYASKGDKVCERCHNNDSPFKASVDPKYAFNLKERLKSTASSFHEIYPMEGKHD